MPTLCVISELSVCLLFHKVYVCLLQSYEMSQMVECYQVEMVALLNLGISCELTNNLWKAIEWHTLVNNIDL